MKMYWVVKYALTSGIYSQELNTADTGYAYCDLTWLKIGKECFESRQEALEAAETMRLNRIRSLQKQLAKLEQMTFKEE